MPVLRNPFRKNVVVPGVEQKSTDRPEISPLHPKAEGEKAASSIAILGQRRDEEPDTFKLCGKFTLLDILDGQQFTGSVQHIRTSGAFYAVMCCLPFPRFRTSFLNK